MHPALLSENSIWNFGYSFYYVLQMNEPKKFDNILLIITAIIIAIIMPFYLMNVIYPLFQIFLPEGNIILTPPLRITATIIMGIIDYGLAYIPIYYTNKRKSIWFNLVCFILTMLWCMAVGVLWYIAID